MDNKILDMMMELAHGYHGKAHQAIRQAKFATAILEVMRGKEPLRAYEIADLINKTYPDIFWDGFIVTYQKVYAWLFILMDLKKVKIIDTGKEQFIRHGDSNIGHLASIKKFQLVD